MEGIKSEYDIQDGMFIRKDTQDVEKLLDQNQREYNDGVHTDRSSNMRKVASIPLVVVEALKNRPMSEGGPIDLNRIGFDVDHAVRFHRWLNDRDNRKFRTSNARV